MRDGFLERHGSEPAVSLTCSDKSTTSATISRITTSVGDYVIRESYHPGPSGNCSDGTLHAEPSNRHKHRDTDVREKTEEIVDSEDEYIQPSERLLNPVEAEMDEAYPNAPLFQGHETFDETYLTELA